MRYFKWNLKWLRRWLCAECLGIFTSLSLAALLLGLSSPGIVRAVQATLTQWSFSTNPFGTPFPAEKIALDGQGKVWFSNFLRPSISRLDPGIQSNNITTWPLTENTRFGKANISVFASTSGRVYFPLESTSNRPGLANFQSLASLDPATNTIVEWPLFSLFQGSIDAIMADGSGNVWLGGFRSNVGVILSRLNPSNNEVTQWVLVAPNAGSVANVRPAPDGTIWFTTWQTVGRLDPVTNTLSSWPLAFFPRQTLNTPNLHLDTTGKVWFIGAAFDDLFRLDPATNELTTYDLIGIVSTISASTLDGAGRPTIAGTFPVGGSSGRGVARLDPATNTLTKWVFSPANIEALATDAGGNNWLSESSQTISRLFP